MGNKVDIHYCNMCSKLFILANKKGYDSYDFIEKIMSSELAKHLFDTNDTTIWIGESYVLETIESMIEINKSGKQLSDDCMEWIGYLYKYWNYLYPNETPSDILKQAPVNVLETSYVGLHCLSCEMAIEDLKGIYKQK